MPKASFVLTNRNNEKTIRNCIESLHKLCENEAEIIVVDDLSTDNSVDKTKDLDYIRLFKNEKNEGISYSRNRGVTEATTDLLFFIDTDIVVERLNMDFIVNLFETNPKLAGISGSYKSAHEGGDWNTILDIRREDIYFKRKGTYIYDLNQDYTTFSGGFCAVNKNRVGDLQQIGVKGVSGEDLLYQIKILNQGWQFGFTDQLMGLHWHKRDKRQGKEKIISLVKGGLFVSFESVKNGLRLPSFDPLYSFPIAWILGLLFPPFILWNFLTAILLIITKRQSKYLKLLVYLFKYDLLKIWIFFTDGYVSRYGFMVFFKVFLIGSSNSITGKINWVRRTYFNNNKQLWNL